MKKHLFFFAVIFLFTQTFAQKSDLPGFTETKIENGATYKKYINGKLDSIIVGIYAVNYGNAIYITRNNDEIIIKNGADKNSVIKIQLKSNKQIKTLFYKNKAGVIIENIDFEPANLPKNAEIGSYFSDNLITTTKVTRNPEIFGEENPDKTFKLFFRLEIPSNLNNAENIFNYFGDFFSKEDSLLKIFYGDYAEQFEPQVLSSLKTDNSGNIADGILLDFTAKTKDQKSNYSIYKSGKIIKNGNVSLKDFQKIFKDYQIKAYNN